MHIPLSTYSAIDIRYFSKYKILCVTQVLFAHVITHIYPQHFEICLNYYIMR